MSKHNKVNPGMYTQAGRLSPDDAARERMKQVDNASTRRLEGRPHSQLKGTTSGDAETDPADEESAGQTEPSDDQHARDEEQRTQVVEMRSEAEPERECCRAEQRPGDDRADTGR